MTRHSTPTTMIATDALDVRFDPLPVLPPAVPSTPGSNDASVGDAVGAAMGDSLTAVGASVSTSRVTIVVAYLKAHVVGGKEEGSNASG